MCNDYMFLGVCIGLVVGFAAGMLAGVITYWAAFPKRIRYRR